MKIDEIDLKILRVLQNNAKLSNQELADRIALSPSACLRRVKLLEDNGYISGYQTIINASKLGYNIEAFIAISLDKVTESTHNQFEIEIGQLEEVLNSYIITGETNYILHVRTKNFDDFSNFITYKLNKVAGISKFQSHLVLKKSKEQDQLLPI